MIGLFRPTTNIDFPVAESQEIIEAEHDGRSYCTNVTVGQQVFSLTVDTGSTDTWVPHTDYQCFLTRTNESMPQSDCRIPSTYQPDSTFEPFHDQNLNTSYTDGRYAYGMIGHDRITIAGIIVPRQIVGIATRIGWKADGVTSGMLGLSYS